MSAVALFLEVVREHTPETKWTGATLSPFRQVANTNRGDIGEDFLCRYLRHAGVSVVRSVTRTKMWDLEIEGRRFEVKTASEDVSGAFQFNHIRLDRAYEYLRCLGVRPEEIRFGVWRKGEVSEGAAGTLVRMAEGQSTTHNSTKGVPALRPIEELPGWVRETLTG